MEWDRKWFVDFKSRKTQLVLFDQPNNTGSTDLKMDESFLEEKSSFKMLGLTFSPKLDWGSYIISIAKTAYKKIGTLIRSMKFLSPEVALYLYRSTIRHVRNTVVTSGLVPLVLSTFRQATKTNIQDCWPFTCCFS